jgi:3'-phosphoadenosine 5'-phosphosulfate sulfotransferase (PAPS reductase)/FAD synthetase|tara:strand:+ start:2208 stop:3203 length:996 start_codon:yes stop_codon:yes gene_type:complete
MKMTTEEIKALKEKINGRTLVVSVSGGKDSTATCLHLQEIGLPYEAIFFNTGWEHKDTYEYVNEYLPSKIGPIQHLSKEPELKSPEAEALAVKYEERLGFRSPMVRWCIHKGVFPARLSRWCTQNLKVFAAKDYLRAMEEEPISVVGVRAQESKARSMMDEWEWFEAGDCEVWRPLINWKTEDVIEIHKRHGVRPNPMYLGDNPVDRVGCYPCVYARKEEIKRIASSSPERIALLSDLEKDIHQIRVARAESKGEVLRTPTGWFQSPTGDINPATGKRSGLAWPIDKVVEWARTKRGGRQFELFESLPGEQGCVRWGMCDTGTASKNRTSE